MILFYYSDQSDVLIKFGAYRQSYVPATDTGTSMNKLKIILSSYASTLVFTVKHAPEYHLIMPLTIALK
eukprot:scaffold351192_cov33-Prasinocladus_malaysianus.AAC.1